MYVMIETVAISCDKQLHEHASNELATRDVARFRFGKSKYDKKLIRELINIIFNSDRDLTIEVMAIRSPFVITTCLYGTIEVKK